MSKKINIGLFGFGSVGQGLYELLDQNTSFDAQIEKIVVKNNDKKRALDESHFYYDASVILEDESIDTVVELIDDADAAYKIVVAAIKKGKNVVSANKKLIAYKLEELKTLAGKNDVSFLYEAAVCASIPIIRTLEDYYNTDTIEQINGICNGTTNYIFSQTDRGKSYEKALQEAQELGFAESNPTLDVDGFDAKFKLCILIKHAFGVSVHPDEIFNYGIRHVTKTDVNFGNQRGYRLKLLSSVYLNNDRLTAFVAPQFIKEDDLNYTVDGSLNAVAVKGKFTGEQNLIGIGAGPHPTASAVLSDINALRNDYSYPYDQEQKNEGVHIDNESEIPVYIRSSHTEELSAIPFNQVHEEFRSTDIHFKSGTVALDELMKIDFNGRPDLFLAVLPENLFANQTSKEERLEETTVS